MPLFLFEVEDGVGHGSSLVLAVRDFGVPNDGLDEDGLAIVDAVLLEDLIEVASIGAVDEGLLEVGEFLGFFLGEAVERATEEDTGTDACSDICAVPLAFEEGIGTVSVAHFSRTTVEPAVLDIEFASEGKFGVDSRAGFTLGIAGRQFGLVSAAKRALDFVCHN